MATATTSLPALHRLRPQEQAGLVPALLAAHPELTETLEALALARIRDVDAVEIAGELESRLHDLPLTEPAARAGKQPGTYVHETDAANEIVAEALAPYEEDLWRAAARCLAGPEGRRSGDRTRPRRGRRPLPRLGPAPRRPVAELMTARPMTAHRCASRYASHRSAGSRPRSETAWPAARAHALTCAAVGSRSGASLARPDATTATPRPGGDADGDGPGVKPSSR